MIKVAEPIIGQEEIDAAVEVLKSGMYTSGKIVDKFEKEFAEYIGTKYAVACNSGTAALHMVLKCLGINEGSKVIVPDMSFFATASAVYISGGEVEFADVSSDCNISPRSIEELIDHDTRAIIPVHFYGNPCEMDQIMKIADDNNLFVVEDCAQAHGAEFQGKKVGSFGIANCFSFFATKNMTTIEGGMITTDEKYIYTKCKQLRSHGMTDRNTHAMIGYNYRMTELNAAIGRIQLKKLDMMNSKRIDHSNYLHQRINSDHVKPFLMVNPRVKRVVYFWFPVEVSSVWVPKFMEHLQENGIGYRHRYLKPLHDQPLFRGSFKHLKNSMAELFSGRIFGLPNHPGMKKQQLDEVIEVVNRFKPSFEEKFI